MANSLNFVQLQNLAANAGFPTAEQPVMAAIALAESGGNPNAVNRNDNGGRQSSYGLWQISNGTHDPPSPAWSDPQTNANLAHQKWVTQGLGAWGSYTSGAYKKFLQSNNPGGLDFSTVGNQITYWLGNIWRTFAGGFSGSGENGVDIKLPYHSPVYAISGGTVKGAGSYGGGGVVSVRERPGWVWYYQHLSDWVVAPGQTVTPGQLLGYSGGQVGYGDHPSQPAYSSTPHIEVGINAPWGGIWGGGEGPNINPLPYLKSINPGIAATPTSGGSGAQTLSDTTLGFGPLDQIGAAVGGIANFFKQIGGIVEWLGNPMRIIKLMMGSGLILVGIALTFRGEAAAVVLTAAGQPELAAVGHEAGSARHMVHSRVTSHVRRARRTKAAAQQKKGSATTP